jgi:hypothetical protein
VKLFLSYPRRPQPQIKDVAISFERNAGWKVGCPVTSENMFCGGNCLLACGKQMHSDLLIRGEFHRIVTKFKENFKRNEIQEMWKQN